MRQKNFCSKECAYASQAKARDYKRRPRAFRCLERRVVVNKADDFGFDRGYLQTAALLHGATRAPRGS